MGVFLILQLPKTRTLSWISYSTFTKMIISKKLTIYEKL